MKRFIPVAAFIVIILLSGCSNESKYDDDDVALVVGKKEVTVGDLRFLYADDEMIDMLEGTVKAELAIQEAKRRGTDISAMKQETIDARLAMPMKKESDANRAFFEAQAKKLGTDPETYRKQYVERTAERGAYTAAYVESILDEPRWTDDTNKNDEMAERYNVKANELLDKLVVEHEDDVKILMK